MCSRDTSTTIFWYICQLFCLLVKIKTAQPFSHFVMCTLSQILSSKDLTIYEYMFTWIYCYVTFVNLSLPVPSHFVSYVIQYTYKLYLNLDRIINDIKQNIKPIISNLFCFLCTLIFKLKTQMNPLMNNQETRTLTFAGNYCLLYRNV